MAADTEAWLTEAQRRDLIALAERVEGLGEELGCRVAAYAPYYAVTELGAVWSIASGRWKQLHPKIGASGYAGLTLSEDGKTVSRRLNRVIATAFYGPPPSPRHVARHLNDDRSDNRVANIRWGTPAENSQDAVRNGRCVAGDNSRRSAHKRRADLATNRKLSSSDIPVIRDRLKRGEAGAAIGRDLGVSKYTISLIKRGRSWTSV